MPTRVLIAYYISYYTYGRQPVQGNVDAACKVFGFVKALVWATIYIINNRARRKKSVNQNIRPDIDMLNCVKNVYIKFVSW